MAAFLAAYWPWAIFAPAGILAIWSLRDSTRRAIRSYHTLKRELEDHQ